jgi:hypothetical protein
VRILLHLCCANCAIYPVSVLREQNHQVGGFFFNHNIHPYLEFKRRLDTVKEYASKVDLPVLYREEYLLEEFLAAAAPQPPLRCDFCYRSRLEMTARVAAENGFEGFSTTLLYSRYQQHQKIRNFGETLAAHHGIQFFYQDFRQGWKQGIDASKAMGLYRQQYCGCIYSEKERYYPRCRN